MVKKKEEPNALCKLIDEWLDQQPEFKSLENYNETTPSPTPSNVTMFSGRRNL